ncbi:uncharacterized protein ARMOST_20563 [Armillaria ostoyae]|uniref:Uncharacterized protein n=1 Tax=Armillaria ostoyae TaxID=47428 RepID=A0A284S7Q6_ARMOS|nr:uncharacterized protein ARMOST_20563 [Armillaria ostoyae]
MTIRHAVGRDGPRSRSHSIFSHRQRTFGTLPIRPGSTNVGKDLDFRASLRTLPIALIGKRYKVSQLIQIKFLTSSYSRFFGQRFTSRRNRLADVSERFTTTLS